MLGASTRRSFSWTSLPAEIRLMVLEAITQQKHPGWASLASVCKEWQFSIEKQNFRRLKLQASCLDDFERVMQQSKRTRLVRHIWLDVELPEYSCHLCKRSESYSWSDRNSSIISKGIWKLFRILSNWESRPELGRRELTLELNAYSPSDSKHWFKNHYFTSDNKDNEEDGTFNCSSWHDPQHGWVDGRQNTTPPCSAVLRLFGPIDLRFKQDLPRVEIVTGFVVRRQLRRQLRPSSLLLLLNKLSGLEHMTYEPWRVWERDWRVINDKHFSQLVQNHLPQTLKRVSIFEDFSESLARTIDQTRQLIPWQPQVEISRVVDPRVAGAFAARSVDLEQLSVAYMVNAEDFFHRAARNSSWTWHRLESLALTSQLLRRDTQSREDIDALLHVAGTTALRMPRLQALVLWNGIEGEACAFIYHTDGGRAASITWRGTWDMQLSSRVVKAWQCVATENRLYGALQVRKQQVHDVIGSHGDAIHYLGLPCPVVAPASLWQIRREENAARDASR